MNRRWRIELLGGLRAMQGDREVSRFRTHKTAALLAYLAYHGHRAHSRDELVDVLWPDDELEAGRSRLRVALSSLRRQLEPMGDPAETLFIVNRSSLRLNPA